MKYKRGKKIKLTRSNFFAYFTCATYYLMLIIFFTWLGYMLMSIILMSLK